VQVLRAVLEINMNFSMQVMLFLVVITLHFGESSQTSCGKGTQPHMQSRIYER